MYLEFVCTNVLRVMNCFEQFDRMPAAKTYCIYFLSSVAFFSYFPSVLSSICRGESHSLRSACIVASAMDNGLVVNVKGGEYVNHRLCLCQVLRAIAVSVDITITLH